MPVVRDHDERALVPVQKFFEPVDRVQVEVVGRLIEQQCLRMSEQRLREQNAHLLSALELGHLPVMELVGNVEALQQDRGVAFGGVTVLFADDALELAQAHARFVRHFRHLRTACRARSARPRAVDCP